MSSDVKGRIKFQIAPIGLKLGKIILRTERVCETDIEGGRRPMSFAVKGRVKFQIAPIRLKLKEVILRTGRVGN